MLYSIQLPLPYKIMHIENIIIVLFFYNYLFLLQQLLFCNNSATSLPMSLFIHDIMQTIYDI